MIMRRMACSRRKFMLVLVFIVAGFIWYTFVLSVFHISRLPTDSDTDVPSKSKVTLFIPQINTPPKSSHYGHSKTKVTSYIPQINTTPKSSNSKQDLKKHLNEKDQANDQAEKDSKARKIQIERACKKYRKQSIFEHLPWNDKIIKKEKSNVLHHIVLSEEHKVLYCFIPKVACSNMKRIFVVLNGLYPDVKHVNGDKLNKEIVRLGKFKRANILNMLKNFYKFMMVRDPFERLVSAYRNKWMDKVNVQLHATLGKMIVRRYRFNNKQDADPAGNDVTFTEYAQYLIDTPSQNLNEHWMPYNDLCRPCDVKYDFIGSIDTISRDVAYAMRHINVDDTKYFIKPAGKNSLVETKKVTADFLKQLPEKVFNGLVAKYRMDHQLFGYPIPNYKKLKERYNSETKN